MVGAALAPAAGRPLVRLVARGLAVLTGHVDPLQHAAVAVDAARQPEGVVEGHAAEVLAAVVPVVVAGGVPALGELERGQVAAARVGRVGRRVVELVPHERELPGVEARLGPVGVLAGPEVAADARLDVAVVVRGDAEADGDLLALEVLGDHRGRRHLVAVHVLREGVLPVRHARLRAAADWDGRAFGGAGVSVRPWRARGGAEGAHSRPRPAC